MRVLAYELNEVPWRVIDDHVARHPDGALARILAGGATFTTRTADAGHLSPWVTWPTMHRGVPNTQHKVADLGQDPATFRFDPLWVPIRRAGRSVGLFGCLQSWPPIDPGPQGFHVPDMFAQDARCQPPRLEPFQEFNLANAREGGRLVPAFDARLAARFALRLPGMGVRWRSLAKAGAQVGGELADRRARHRRPAFQHILGFDIFCAQYRRRRPEYAAYFTNHVAGFMHRYWRATYPQDFKEAGDADDPYYGKAIPWGMELADRDLARLLRLVEADPDLVLVVASSMGQASIRPPAKDLSARVSDMERLVRAVGHAGPWERRHAMEPQFPLAFPDPAAAESFAERARHVVDADGKRVLACHVVDRVVSLTVLPTRALVHGRAATVPGRGTLSLEELGLETLEPETPGTAYHVPEGSLVVYGEAIRPDPSRREVSVLQYAPTLLDLMGVPVPPHMAAASLASSLLRAPLPAASVPA